MRYASKVPPAPPPIGDAGDNGDDEKTVSVAFPVQPGTKPILHGDLVRLSAAEADIAELTIKLRGQHTVVENFIEAVRNRDNGPLFDPATKRRLYELDAFVVEALCDALERKIF